MIDTNNRLSLLPLIYIYTWIPPDGKTRNQINYIVIPNESLKIIKNCRVFNTADIGSDHSLLMAKVLIQQKKIPKRKPSMRIYNVEYFKQPEISETVQYKIRGRFEPLMALDSDIDELYDEFKKIINKANEETEIFERESLSMISHKRR